MKTIKKKALFMALILGSMALAACGGRSSNSEKSSEKPAESTVSSSASSEETPASSESATNAPASSAEVSTEAPSEASSSSSKSKKSRSSSESGGNENLPEYQVVIDAKDGSDPVTKGVKYGAGIAKPADPVAPEGKTFYGWMNTKNGGQIWDFDDEWLNAVYDDVALEPLFIDSSFTQSRIEAELAPIISEANDGDGMDGATYSGGQKGRGLIYDAYSGDFNIEPMYVYDIDYDEEMRIARLATPQDNPEDTFGCFVHFLYVQGSKLTWEIESSAAVENAVMFMKIASEYGQEDEYNGVNCAFNDQMVPITVNGTALQYGQVTVHGIVLKDMMPFQDYLLSTTVSLNQGKNIIELEVANDTFIFGTAGSTAPMIDCLKVYSSSEITTTNAKLANLNKDL